MRLSTVLLSLGLFLSLWEISLPAYAYLDSGSGNLLIQLLFGGLAGFIAILKLYWAKLCDFFNRFRPSKKQKETEAQDKSKPETPSNDDPQP